VLRRQRAALAGADEWHLLEPTMPTHHDKTINEMHLISPDQMRMAELHPTTLRASVPRRGRRRRSAYVILLFLRWTTSTKPPPPLHYELASARY
jgi:hypothetical protein